MSQNQPSPLDLVLAALPEVWRRRRVALAIFAVVALSALATGWFWPKVYVSSAQIRIDSQNILKPLMEGTAVATAVESYTELARQIIQSQHAKEQLLTLLSDDVEGMSETEKDRFWEKVLERTSVQGMGKDLIQIEFRATTPEHAKRMAVFFTDIYISGSIESKKNESESAFEFISVQAEEYHEKLRNAEEALKQFRSANLDSSPDSEKIVSDRIIELQRKIEQTTLEMRENKSQLLNINEQLSGATSSTSQLAEESILDDRITTLQTQLDRLRMTYHDTYPDIVILQDQIKGLEKQKLSIRDRSAGPKISGTNALSAELRSLYAKYTNQDTLLNARLKETQNLLEKEKQRARHINEYEASLAQLTRDYEVNRDIFQKLLRQRESARVSMNIDQSNQGLTLKIQEAPVLPIRPVGIRFIHFVIAGAAASVLVPFGVIFALVMLDGRIRSPNVLREFTSVPVLGSIPTYSNTEQRRLYAQWTWISTAVVFLVAAVYITAGLMKM